MEQYQGNSTMDENKLKIWLHKGNKSYNWKIIKY